MNIALFIIALAMFALIIWATAEHYINCFRMARKYNRKRRP